MGCVFLARLAGWSSQNHQRMSGFASFLIFSVRIFSARMPDISFQRTPCPVAKLYKASRKWYSTVNPSCCTVPKRPPLRPQRAHPSVAFCFPATSRFIEILTWSQQLHEIKHFGEAYRGQCTLVGRYHTSYSE